jgi:hypothetical protein
VDSKEEVRQLFVRNGKYGFGMTFEKGKSRHGSSSGLTKSLVRKKLIK